MKDVYQSVRNEKGITLVERSLERRGLTYWMKDIGASEAVIRVGRTDEKKPTFVSVDVGFVSHLDAVSRFGNGHLSSLEESPTAYKLNGLGVLRFGDRDSEGQEVDDWALFRGPKFDSSYLVGVLRQSSLGKLLLGPRYTPLSRI